PESRKRAGLEEGGRGLPARAPPWASRGARRPCRRARRKRAPIRPRRGEGRPARCPPRLPGWGRSSLPGAGLSHVGDELLREAGATPGGGDEISPLGAGRGEGEGSCLPVGLHLGEPWIL